MKKVTKKQLKAVRAVNKETQRIEDEKAATILVDLHFAADGDIPVLCGEFEASTILAMLKDRRYYNRINRLLESRF